MQALTRRTIAGLATLVFLTGALVLAGTQAPSGTSSGTSGAQPPSSSPGQAGTPAPASLARGSTILLVRHAEKDAAGDPKDPGLGEVGKKRAQALARVCARAGVSGLYTSEFRRARETAAPLAAALGIEAKVIPAGDPAALVRALDALPDGSVSVVVGHSNTVPDLVARLGGEVQGLAPPAGGKPNAGKMLPEDAFDRVFVVTRPPLAQRGAVAVTTLELAYGD